MVAVNHLRCLQAWPLTLYIMSRGRTGDGRGGVGTASARFTGKPESAPAPAPLSTTNTSSSPPEEPELTSVTDDDVSYCLVDVDSSELDLSSLLSLPALDSFEDNMVLFGKLIG